MKPDTAVISGARDDEETTLDSAQEASAAGVVRVFAEDLEAAGHERGPDGRAAGRLPERRRSGVDPGRARRAAHMCTIASGGVVFHRPRVKSGTATGCPFRATD